MKLVSYESIMSPLTNPFKVRLSRLNNMISALLISLYGEMTTLLCTLAKGYTKVVDLPRKILNLLYDLSLLLKFMSCLSNVPSGYAITTKILKVLMYSFKIVLLNFFLHQYFPLFKKSLFKMFISSVWVFCIFKVESLTKDLTFTDIKKSSKITHKIVINNLFP